LRDSIHTEMHATLPSAKVGPGGPAAAYAAAVEFGWRGWGKSKKTGKPYWWAPVGKTSAGKRWLADHGMLAGARQSLGKGHRYYYGRGITSGAPVFEYENIMYLRVSGDPTKHPPRPYLLPALEANRAQAKAIIAKHIAAAVHGQTTGGAG